MVINKIPCDDKTGWEAIATEGNATAYIKKWNDLVCLWFSGNWMTVSNITIPAEYRPSSTIYLSCVGNSGTGMNFDRLQINTNGTMSLVNETKTFGQLIYML